MIIILTLLTAGCVSSILCLMILSTVIASQATDIRNLQNRLNDYIHKDDLDEILLDSDLVIDALTRSLQRHKD